MSDAVLTLEKFKEIADGEMFAEGTIIDSPDGCNMSGSGKMLRFVAVKGWAVDWCVYVSWAEYSAAYVRENGDKVIGPENIRRCVPCDDDVLGRYRY